MKDRHGNEWVMVPRELTRDQKMAAVHEWGKSQDFGAMYAAAIAAAPKFEAAEVDDAMAERIWGVVYADEPFILSMGITQGDREWCRSWLTAWQAELGPALGMVSREEMAAQVEAAVMDEGKLWSLIRNVLSQGGAIQLDRASMSGYEEYSARLDAAASDRVAEFAKLSDTRIAELEAALAEARRDAERYRWLRDQGGREVDAPWVVFRGGTWFLRSELDAAIDAARAGNGVGLEAVG